MSSREAELEEEMWAWVSKHRRDPRVTRWLTKHPPPAEWEGSAIEYAYLEMPDLNSVVGRVARWLGA